MGHEIIQSNVISMCWERGHKFLLILFGLSMITTLCLWLSCIRH